MGPDGHVCLHSGRHMLTQNRHHPSSRLTALARLFQYLRNHYLAMNSAVQVIFAHHQILIDAFIVGYDKSQTTLDINTPDDFTIDMFQNLHQRTFTASALIDSDNPYNCPIPVQKRPHLARCQKQVVAAIIRLQEPKTILVTYDPPCDQILSIDQTIPIAAVAYNLSVSLHRVQPPT